MKGCIQIYTHICTHTHHIYYMSCSMMLACFHWVGEIFRLAWHVVFLISEVSASAIKLTQATCEHIPTSAGDKGRSKQIKQLFWSQYANYFWWGWCSNIDLQGA